MSGERHWLLSYGHALPMLDHERPGCRRVDRECARRCGRPREIVSFARPAGQLVCVECRATGTDSRGWRAELAPDDAGVDELEVPVYCPACWERREFGDE